MTKTNYHRSKEDDCWGSTERQPRRRRGNIWPTKRQKRWQRQLVKTKSIGKDKDKDKWRSYLRGRLLMVPTKTHKKEERWLLAGETGLQANHWSSRIRWVLKKCQKLIETFNRAIYRFLQAGHYAKPSASSRPSRRTSDYRNYRSLKGISRRFSREPTPGDPMSYIEYR